MTTSTKKKRVARPANVRNTRPSLALTQGPHWGSFEKFRVQGQDALKTITPGAVGTLVTKSGSFRVLRDEDFQRLYGLARDVDRIRRGMRVILTAARTVQQHPDSPSSVETLIEAALLLGDSPVLPTRESFEPLLPEETGTQRGSAAADDEDEVEIDPAAVRRPYAPAATG
jgi:hypothetical protein